MYDPQGQLYFFIFSWLSVKDRRCWVNPHLDAVFCFCHRADLEEVHWCSKEPEAVYVCPAERVLKGNSENSFLSLRHIHLGWCNPLLIPLHMPGKHKSIQKYTSMVCSATLCKHIRVQADKSQMQQLPDISISLPLLLLLSSHFLSLRDKHKLPSFLLYKSQQLWGFSAPRDVSSVAFWRKQREIPWLGLRWTLVSPREAWWTLWRCLT